MNSYMLSDSIIGDGKDFANEGYLETDRQGDDLDLENMLGKGSSSGKKYSVLDASIDVDNSIMAIE